MVGSNCKEGGVWAGRVGTRTGDKTQGVGLVSGVETVLVAAGVVGSVVGVATGIGAVAGCGAAQAAMVARIRIVIRIVLKFVFKLISYSNARTSTPLRGSNLRWCASTWCSASLRITRCRPQ